MHLAVQLLHGPPTPVLTYLSTRHEVKGIVRRWWRCTSVGDAPPLSDARFLCFLQSEEVFDDGDFYQRWLKQVVEGRSVDATSPASHR